MNSKCATTQHRRSFQQQAGEREEKVGECLWLMMCLCHVISQRLWFNCDSADHTASRLLSPASHSFHFPGGIFLMKEIKSNEELKTQFTTTTSPQLFMKHTELCDSRESDARSLAGRPRGTQHQFVTGGRSWPQTAEQAVVVVRLLNITCQADWKVTSRRRWWIWSWETASNNHSSKIQWQQLMTFGNVINYETTSETKRAGF